MKNNKHRNYQKKWGIVEKTPTGTIGKLFDNHTFQCIPDPAKEQTWNSFDIRFETFNFKTKEFTAENVLTEQSSKIFVKEEIRDYPTVDEKNEKIVVKNVFDVYKRPIKYIKITGVVIDSTDEEMIVEFSETSGICDEDRLSWDFNEEKTKKLKEKKAAVSA